MSFSDIRPARHIDMSAFAQAHPFELSDGRRFKSLLLAAGTLLKAEHPDPYATVTDTAQNRTYDRLDCARIVSGGRVYAA